MTWGRLERSYFFGCTCVRCQTEAERDISAIEEQEDIEFLLRYGSPGRPGCPSFDERLRQQGGVELAVARCVINRIAELVPHGDHSSPNYDWPADLQPLITVGRMSNAGRIQGNHFGLIVIKEHIHLWRHYSRLEQDVDQALEDWLPLPLSQYTRPVSYYKHALDCRCNENPDSQHPLANGPLINLLVSIEKDLETRGSPPSLVDDLARIGEELEEPFIRAADDGDNPDEFVSDVVYPRIARKLLDERAIKEDAQRINQSISNSANAAPAPPVNQDPDDWFGIIKVDCNGVSLPISGPSADIRMQWTQGVHRAEQVLFMVSGPQQGVLEILADIVSLHSTLTIPIPAIAPPAPQTSYIYTYHADPGTWLSVFYIGKGRHLRFRSHLDMIYRRIVEAAPALGVTIARSEKEKKIESYLRGPALVSWPASAAYITARYKTAGLQPPSHAAPFLMRTVQAFPSVAAGDYSDVRSQAAEKFLINFRYGVYNVANETSGNDPAGFGLLVRPSWWTAGDPESQRWQDACDYMMTNGRLRPFQKAKLALPIVRPYVPAIDAGLVPLNVGPTVVPAAGGIAAFPHLAPVGAGDLMLTYDVHARPYGLEIRMDARESLGSIRMRPGLGTQPHEFLNYVNQHTGLVVTRPPDPYFRPFRVCGTIDDQRVLFGVGNVLNDPRFSAANVEFRGQTPPVWTGCHVVNLFEAVQLIINRFP